MTRRWKLFLIRPEDAGPHGQPLLSRTTYATRKSAQIHGRRVVRQHPGWRYRTKPTFEGGEE